MGGATSEVTPSTTDVLIEAAHFDPVTVARSSRRHKLVTEASKRFERGADPALPPAAAQLCVDLLVEHGGGTADAAVTDVDETTPRDAYELDVALPTRLVGVDYPRERVVEILRAEGCAVDDEGGPTLRVTPPTWRPDLVDGPDYAEEVARIDGYEKIPSIVRTPPSGRGLTHGQRVRRIVANALVARGFVEVLTYPFVGDGVADALGLKADDERRYAVRVANPLSDEAPLMRTSVLSTLVEALRRNVSRGRKDIALFELGTVTLPRGRRNAYRSRPRRRPPSRRRDHQGDVRGRTAAAPPRRRRHGRRGGADRLVGSRTGGLVGGRGRVGARRGAGGRGPVEVGPETDHAPWHPGRCARIVLTDGTLVGYAGELHPKTLAALGLPARTVALELDVDELTRASEPTTRYHEISTYPAALTDVALVVADTVTAGEVERSLRSGAGDYLEEVALFDAYAGEQVGDGRTSLAYRLTFRAPDRTLTTEEVNEFRDAAVASAGDAVGAVQRT